MPHYDEMTLALLALGESDVTDDGAQHLAACARCRAEVDQLGAVVAIGRSLDDADYPATPSSAVWDRILDDVREDERATGARLANATAPLASTALLAERAAPGRRARWGFSLAAAAAVGVLVGTGVTWNVTRSTTPTPQVSPSQVSVAALRPVDTPNAAGTAVLSVVSAHQRTMTVTVVNLPTQPGTFYEVWLMDPTNSHLVSLGVLGSEGHGAYVVPAGLDLTMYSAVDVSLQPMNGSPEHSKNSAVRGTLTT